MPVAAGVNEAGLRAVVAFLAFFPECWDQLAPLGKYRGTATYCFATLACWLAGEPIDDLIEAAVFAGEPDEYGIYRTAARLLGLDENQARRIFQFSRTPSGAHPSLAEFCERITAETGVSFDVGIL